MFEIVFPSIVALGILLLFISVDLSPSGIVKKIIEVNGFLINVIAIQIGFNITAMALIVSFNKESIKKVFTTDTEEKSRNLIEQLLASFAYCVVIQTFIIIIGILFLTVNESVSLLSNTYNFNEITKEIIVCIFTFFWTFSIGHSFSVFYRNVSLIYKFILVILKK